MASSIPQAGQRTSVSSTQPWSDTAHSLWEATSNERPPISTLDSALRADVVVIGAGYLGLAAALQLAEQGTNVIVLDAQGPGYGASGRNGGQLIPGLKHDPDDLATLYGAALAERLVEFAGAAPDRVFGLIDRYRIDCDPVRKGWIQGAHNATALAAVQSRARQWIDRGASAELLDARAVTHAVGCAPGVYQGGWIDRRAGSLHPLNYALGLASAAMSCGVRIFGRTTASRIDRVNNHWVVSTAQGASVTASQVVIATNAYTDDLWPKLRTSIIPAQSFQIATDPLPPSLRASMLRDRPVVSDARRLLHYYRFDAEGRFVMGGRGTLSAPRGFDDFRHILRAVAKTFPQLSDVPARFAWAGRLAMTRDGMPHVHQPVPGITIALGCNGRGIALTTAMGQEIAQNLLTGAALPLTGSAVRPIPLHGMHRLYVSLLVQYYKIRDML